MDATNYTGWVPSRPSHSGYHAVKPVGHATLCTTMALVVAGLALAFLEASVLTRPSTGLPPVSDPVLAALFG